MLVRNVPKEWLITTDEDKAKQLLQAKQIVKRIKEDEANGVPLPAVDGIKLVGVSRDLI